MIDPKYRFKTVAMHYTRECNMNCPFCYRKEADGPAKPREFFIELVKYIKELAPQISLGGGEPLIDTEFVKNIGKECRMESIYLNITTNGKIVLKMSRDEVKDVFENV